mmetsp:Transcript_12875/g.14770  ORF Transcript_12875/g.14770 Transcript_12875/m.14770 type:complete len:368 (-) Transcript_12875:313-1416(-)
MSMRSFLPLLLAASPHSIEMFTTPMRAISRTKALHRSLSMTASASTSTGTGSSATSGTTVDYGGIPHIGVLVDNKVKALEYYTDILKMKPSPNGVFAGETQIQFLESSNNPDPIDVDPSYNMSAPPPGYIAEGRPVHAGRDRHVAITLHSLEPLKASLEANNVPYTMSYSGRQALFCRDLWGNGWEFGPPVTYAKATRLFPPYLDVDVEAATLETEPIRWGGVAHVGLLVQNTPITRRFYCDVLGMVDETDLRPEALPFPGLFLRCGEQQVHILELPNPDPNTFQQRPGHGKDRRTAYSVKSLVPVVQALEQEGVEYRREELSSGESVVFCYDPDANELMFVEDGDIQVIQEDMINMAPMVPWTRLW